MSKDWTGVGSDPGGLVIDKAHGESTAVAIARVRGWGARSFASFSGPEKSLGSFDALDAGRKAEASQPQAPP